MEFKTWAEPAILVFFKTDPSKVVATVLISAGLIPVTRVGTVVFFSTITNYRLARFWFFAGIEIVDKGGVVVIELILAYKSTESWVRTRDPEVIKSYFLAKSVVICELV